MCCLHGLQLLSAWALAANSGRQLQQAASSACNPIGGPNGSALDTLPFPFNPGLVPPCPLSLGMARPHARCPALYTHPTLLAAVSGTPLYPQPQPGPYPQRCGLRVWYTPCLVHTAPCTLHVRCTPRLVHPMSSAHRALYTPCLVHTAPCTLHVRCTPRLVHSMSGARRACYTNLPSQGPSPDPSAMVCGLATEQAGR